MYESLHQEVSTPFGYADPSLNKEKGPTQRYNRIYHASSHDATQEQLFNIRPAESAYHQVIDASIDFNSRQPLDASSVAATRNDPASLSDLSLDAHALSRDRRTSFLDQPLVTKNLLYPQPSQSSNGAANWGPGLHYSNLSIAYPEDAFSSFIDTIGVPSNPFDPSYQPIPDWALDLPYLSRHRLLNPQRSRSGSAAEELGLQSTSWASRVPSVQPQEQQLELPHIHRRSVPNDAA